MRITLFLRALACAELPRSLDVRPAPSTAHAERPLFGGRGLGLALGIVSIFGTSILSPGPLVDSFEATLVLTPSREEAAQARLLEAQHILRIWNRRQGPFAGPIKRV